MLSHFPKEISKSSRAPRSVTFQSEANAARFGAIGNVVARGRTSMKKNFYAHCRPIGLSYTEGLESGPLLAQRVSRGVVLLTRIEQAGLAR